MRALRAIVAVGAVTLSSPAFALGLTPGPVGIYFAFLHFLSEMPVPLTLITLGLLLGLNGHQAFRWAWPSLMLAMPVGLVGILEFRIFIYPESPLLLLTIVVGLWAASGIVVPAYAAAIISLCVGYFLGVFIAPAPASWSTQAYAIVGGLLAVNFVVICVFLIVELIRTWWDMPWIGIALRVVASWLTAIAALVAALLLR